MAFKIDGVEMPRPSEWLVNPKPLSSEAERVAGTGEAVVPYLRMVYEVTWTYKYIQTQDFDKIYNAYIKATIKNKSMYHTIETLDSNSDETLSLNVYTQSDFSAPLYRIKNGIRYYKDVKLVFVSR